MVVRECRDPIERDFLRAEIEEEAAEGGGRWTTSIKGEGLEEGGREGERGEERGVGEREPEREIGRETGKEGEGYRED